MTLEYKYFSGRNTLLYLGHWLSIGTLVYLYFNISELFKVVVACTIYAAFRFCLQLTSRSGLSHTALANVQSRVLPDQRSGCRSLAAS